MKFSFYSDDILQLRTDLIGLLCFEDRPMVRFAFDFKVGSNRNSTLGYRFDEKPGHETSARFLANYFAAPLYAAPHPRQAAPPLPCQTRFVPHEAHLKSVFKQAPQCLHECLRLPPDAVLSIALPHNGQTL